MLLKTLIILAGFIYYSRKKLIYGNGIKHLLQHKLLRSKKTDNKKTTDQL